MRTRVLFFSVAAVLTKAASFAQWDLHLGHSFDTAAGSAKYWKKSPYVTLGDKAVMLTPTHKTGFLWNIVRSMMLSWEVTVTFQISAAATEDYSTKGEGLAFWYTKRPGVLGPVYGSVDFWTGLGIFFTVATDPAKKQKFLMVKASLNDGTQQHGSATQTTTNQFSSGDFSAGEADGGSCIRKIHDQTIFSATIKYNDGQLTVSINREHEDGTMCFTINQIELGVDKFFGLSAHGVGADDQHNVLSVRTSAPHERPTEQQLQTVRHAYEESLDKQHKKEHHALTKEDFRIEALNLLHQVQDSQTLMEEEVEELTGMLGYTLGLVSNHTDDMTSLHLHILELRKTVRAALSQPGTPPASVETTSHQHNEEIDGALLQLRRHLDRKLDGMKSISLWSRLLPFLLLALFVALVAVSTMYYREHERRCQFDRSKRFI